MDLWCCSVVGAVMAAALHLKPATVRIWGQEFPVKVEQHRDGWWIAEPEQNKWGYYGASKFSAADAVDRLNEITNWHRRAV